MFSSYFVKNVVCQYIATAVANSMYNDIVMNIKYTVRPYLTYQTGKINNKDATTTSVNGKLANGNRFELKNVRFDNSKNNMAKIYFVQMNNTDLTNTAELQLRLLNLAGEFDCVVTATDSKNYNGKFAFAFKTIRIVPVMNFNDKTVDTQVFVSTPVVENKSVGSADSAAIWTDAEEQLTTDLVKYFKQNLADTISQNIQNIMWFVLKRNAYWSNLDICKHFKYRSSYFSLHVCVR